MAASWRTWLPLIAGGLVGFPLGYAVGYVGRSPLYGTSLLGYLYIPVGITLVLVIVLGVWAAARHSKAALLALASLLVLGFVGTLVAPTPPGESDSGPDWISIGTDALDAITDGGPVITADDPEQPGEPCDRQAASNAQACRCAAA